jgi:hypothetical protein
MLTVYRKAVHVRDRSLFRFIPLRQLDGGFSAMPRGKPAGGESRPAEPEPHDATGEVGTQLRAG